MFEYLLPFAVDVIKFIVVSIIFKYIIAKWVAEQIVEFFKYFLIRSRRQAVYWVHYREKAMHKGHQYKTPEVCEDGVCKSYQLVESA